jgi:poly-gamma-glutamate capsule biosynthesis protein CapA/YwtB (metallophosphatase superfamily)
VERYGEALICYSLGNLVFDEMSPGGNEGYLLTVSVSPEGPTAYRLQPTRVERAQALLDGPATEHAW